jgi:hypothetical protein
LSKSRAIEKLSKLAVDTGIPSYFLDRGAITATLSTIHISSQVIIEEIGHTREGRWKEY